MENLLRSSRMLRHDATIIVAECRAAFSTWGDRALLLGILVIVAAFLRSTASGVPDDRLVPLSAIVGVSIGAAIQGAALRRLNFFAAETALAHEALSQAGARKYLLTVHCAALAMLLLFALTFRPAAAPGIIGGYALGALAALGMRATFKHLPFCPGFPVRRPAMAGMRGRLSPPLAGATAGLAAAAAWFLQAQLSENVGLGFFAMIVTGALLIFGRVDHAVIQFQAIAGFAPGPSVWSHSKNVAAFLAVLIPLTALSSCSLALVAALLGAAVLILNAARICLYRLHSKRAADFLLMAFGGVLILIATSTPIIVPVLGLAVAVALWRRSVGVAWLMP